MTTGTSINMTICTNMFLALELVCLIMVVVSGGIAMNDITIHMCALCWNPIGLRIFEL